MNNFTHSFYIHEWISIWDQICQKLNVVTIILFFGVKYSLKETHWNVQQNNQVSDFDHFKSIKKIEPPYSTYVRDEVSVNSKIPPPLSDGKIPLFL